MLMVFRTESSPGQAEGMSSLSKRRTSLAFIACMRSLELESRCCNDSSTTRLMRNNMKILYKSPGWSDAVARREISRCIATRMSNHIGDLRQGIRASSNKTSSRVFFQRRGTSTGLPSGPKKPKKSLVTILGCVVSRSSSCS